MVMIDDVELLVGADDMGNCLALQIGVTLLGGHFGDFRRAACDFLKSEGELRRPDIVNLNHPLRHVRLHC